MDNENESVVAFVNAVVDGKVIATSNGLPEDWNQLVIPLPESINDIEVQMITAR